MPLHLRESHSTPPFAPLVTPHSPQVSHAHNLGLGVERPTPKPLWWTLERGWPQHGWPKVDFFGGGGLRGRYALLTYTRSYPPRSPQRLTVASAIHRSLYPEDTLVESPACPNLTATPTTNLYCPPPPPPHTGREPLPAGVRWIRGARLLIGDGGDHPASPLQEGVAPRQAERAKLVGCGAQPDRRRRTLEVS